MADLFQAAFDRLAAVHASNPQKRPCGRCGKRRVLGLTGFCDDCSRGCRLWTLKI